MVDVAAFSCVGKRGPRRDERRRNVIGTRRSSCNAAWRIIFLVGVTVEGAR